MQRLLREGGGALQENIPPASPEERLAAEAERGGAPPVPEPVMVKKPAAAPVTSQLPMPGLLPDAEHVEPVRPAPRARPKNDAETERLRVLLTETLHALEELRRLIG